MCLTLRNAVEVLDHRAERTTVIGHTRTRHHIGNLSPGDWWFPGPDPLPHTVCLDVTQNSRLDPLPHTLTAVRRRDGHVVLADQFGGSYSHPFDAVVPTAVRDPRVPRSNT